MNKLYGVEAARGVAALLVVLVHATSMLSGDKYLGHQAFSGLFKFGHAGVDFFFVLSGFIIYFIHHGELSQRRFLKAYWRKRFVRIYPVYWIVLTFFGLILVYSPTKDMLERVPAVILSSLLLAPHPNGPILGVAWTLSHELLFYLLFSLLFVKYRFGLILLGTWLTLILYNMFTQKFDDFFWGGVVFRIFNLGFFYGMLVAYMILHRPIKAPKFLLYFGTALFFGAGIFESWGPSVPLEWPPLHLAYATGAAAALYGLVALEQAGRLSVPSLLVELGKASYSIYLLHVIFIMLIQQVLLRVDLMGTLPDVVIFMGVVFTATTAAVFFSRIIEQPLLRKLRPANTPR